MDIAAKVAVGFVAFEHLVFLIAEMFLWRKPFGLKTFRMSREQAEATAALAANQGLYNGFLAAGLCWGLVAPAHLAFPVTTFFLCCVVVAGIFGAITALKNILFIQAVPAAVALALTWAARAAAS